MLDNKIVPVQYPDSSIGSYFSLYRCNPKAFGVVERIAQEVMRLNGMQAGKGASAATIADVTFRQKS